MRILDEHDIQIRVTSCSKMWWTMEVEAKQKEYGRTKRLYQQERVNAFTLKAKRNSYNYTIR